MPQKIKTMRTSNLNTKNWLWQWHPIICRVTKEIKVKESAQFSSKYGSVFSHSCYSKGVLTHAAVRHSNISVYSLWWADSPTSQFLLPFHFAEHVFRPLKEVRYFGTLVISLCRVQYFCFRIWCDVFTNLRNGKNNLLQGSILTNNLQNETTRVMMYFCTTTRLFSYIL